MRASLTIFTAIFTAILTALIPVTGLCPAARGEDLKPLLQTLQSVGPKGAGNREAAVAWEKLVRADAAELPVILAALDDAGPLAANWIRTAVDAIAGRQLRGGGRLPQERLERFLLDARHAPRARRLAYEWLRRVDPTAPQRLVPKMLDDPSLEMRRDAVDRLIRQGDALLGAQQPDQALSVFRRALTPARDLDQVKRLADRLRKLDQAVDLPRHFGFLVRWKVIGPFDNTDRKGFDTAYPPEQKIDPAASHEGKHGQVRWVDHLTEDRFGKVDLNRVLAKEKSVAAYAVSEFLSYRWQPVEIRAQSVNAVKIWLNGRQVARHEVYHSGSQMDQYVSRVELRPGRNVVLVKVCQNEITPSWADPWGFHLRICDQEGTAVLSTDRKP